MDDDKPTYQERLKGEERLKGILSSDRTAVPSPNKDQNADGAEDSCPAFGYLRGIRDTAAWLEFRFKAGNSEWLPYGWLGPWQHDPSEGLLLKFSGDLVYLVLIRGSNLDQPLNEGTINLTTGGIQRQRVMWIREMTEAEVRQVGDTGPTIDSIELAAFESQAGVKEWLSKKAPAFLQ